ncbi:MAG: hypothetical protein WCP68_02330, partial [Enhydrobacter sp.]
MPDSTFPAPATSASALERQLAAQRARRPADPLLSLVVPVFNEDESIDIFLDAVEPYLDGAGLRFEIAVNGAAHAPVFRATIVIPGAGGMMGDLVGRADAANKKTAEKLAVSLYLYIYMHACMY